MLPPRERYRAELPQHGKKYLTTSKRIIICVYIEPTLSGINTAVSQTDGQVGFSRVLTNKLGSVLTVQSAQKPIWQQ